MQIMSFNCVTLEWQCVVQKKNDPLIQCHKFFIGGAELLKFGLYVTVIKSNLKNVVASMNR